MKGSQKLGSRDEIILAIGDYWKLNGYAPTVREVGNMVGLSSPSTIHHHLTLLHREGRIFWEPKISRTLRVNKRKRA